MILTVTVHSHCAPQRVHPVSGLVIVQPGESYTGEFDEAQEAYIRTCPGHFALPRTFIVPPSPNALQVGDVVTIEGGTVSIVSGQTAPKPKRGRPRKVA